MGEIEIAHTGGKSRIIYSDELNQGILNEDRLEKFHFRRAIGVFNYNYLVF